MRVIGDVSAISRKELEHVLNLVCIERNEWVDREWNLRWRLAELSREVECLPAYPDDDDNVSRASVLALVNSDVVKEAIGAKKAKVPA